MHEVNFGQYEFSRLLTTVREYISIECLMNQMSNEYWQIEHIVMASILEDPQNKNRNRSDYLN